MSGANELARRLAGLPPAKRRLLERLAAREGLAVGSPAGPPPEIADIAEPRRAVAPEEAAAAMAAASGLEPVKGWARGFYDAINARLDGGEVGRWALFLNYGYAEGAEPGRAVVALPPRCLNRNNVRLVLELVGDHDLAGRRVLDVGCGRGGTADALRTWCSPRAVVGLDLSFAAAAFCRRTHGSAAPTPALRFLCGDAERLPFRDGAFDAVTNVESSHSYPYRAAFYREVRRVLRDDGCFLYTDLMPLAAWEAARGLLAAGGFELEVDRDVTANVLASCDEIADRHLHAFGERRGSEVMDEFLAVPGSRVYDEMERGASLYLIQRWRRQA